MTSSDEIKFSDNFDDILIGIRKLIKVEVKDIDVNKSKMIKCGLWLTRLCEVADNFQLCNDIEAPSSAENSYELYLSEILLAEINEEYKLAIKGKYNVKLLHYITKGLKTAKVMWF